MTVVRQRSLYHQLPPAAVSLTRGLARLGAAEHAQSQVQAGVAGDE